LADDKAQTPGASVTLGISAEMQVGQTVLGGDLQIGGKAYGGRLRVVRGQPVDLIDLLKSALGEGSVASAGGLRLEVEEILFAALQAADKDSKTKLIFGLKIRTDVDLTELPLAGAMIRKVLPAGQKVAVEGLQLFICSGSWVRSEYSFLANEDFKIEQMPESLASGVNLLATVWLGKDRKYLGLPSAPRPPETSQPASASPKPLPASQPSTETGSVSLGPSDKTTWIELKKTFGPVLLQRIGLKYEDGAASVLIDGAVNLAALTFSVQGLGAGIKFGDGFKPIFHLQGLSLCLTQGPLTIAGGLLLISQSPLELVGTLLVSATGFTISAIASYADMSGKPSFFAFAALQAPLGGPAFFFVTGLAFGFGVNRSLRLPEIAEVQNFPLIRAATDSDYLGKSLDLRAISARLQTYLPPKDGDFWIAAGVKFTSFRQIESFALLSVSFGTQFQIALLGISKLSVAQPPAPVIVYAELAIKVLFSPESGLLSVEARLTENSYILTREFKLRGGFAFYVWFAGPHEGDFAISLGGYHPRFQVPAHYPRPDLVQFSSRYGNEVTIQGSCYFALCPSAIMAGASLNLVFQAGGIRAWFIAYANLLVQWKPVYYDIEIVISIGVSLTLDFGLFRVSLSVELGASLNLYGPPLGGTARISLSVVSFTISFGVDKAPPPPLLWESDNPEKSFVKSFLAAPAAKGTNSGAGVTQTLVGDGLLEEMKQGDEIIRYVNPHRLVISCRSQIPVTAATRNGQDLPVEWNINLGVRPMRKTQFYSLMEVSLVPAAAGASETDRKEMAQYLDQYIEVSVVTKNVPRALWAGDPANPNVPEKQQTLDNAMVGLEIRTKAGPRPWETPALKLEVLSYDRYYKTFIWFERSPAPALPDYGDKTLASTINDAGVVGIRSAIVKALRESGRKIMEPVDLRLKQLENARYIFQTEPLMARVGQYPPRGYLDT
jgi:hypothetical protein